MSLLHRIQDATVESKSQLADVLRMCKILAARLDHQAFKEWISQELNGYKDLQHLPDYRFLEDLGCRGDFLNTFGMLCKAIPISPLTIPKEFREAVSIQYIPLSVSALESNVSQANQKNESILRNPWPADAIALFNLNIAKSMVCSQAWIDVPTSSLVAILDTVRSRILDFVLEIESEAPDAGEARLSDKPLPENIINYYFNKCILHRDLNMSENFFNNFQGANVANMANTVRDNAQQQANQYIHLSEQQKTLAEAAKEIQQLLEQLELSNPTATETEKIDYVNDETTPSFKRRVVSALQACGEAAIDEFILESKSLKVVKAAVKGWLQPSS